MTLYLNKDDCEKMLKKSVATAVKFLNQINDYDKNSEEYKKIFAELTVLNNIIESINKYIELIEN